MSQKNNWPRILYLHCWSVLLLAVVFALDLFPEEFPFSLGNNPIGQSLLPPMALFLLSSVVVAALRAFLDVFLNLPQLAIHCIGNVLLLIPFTFFHIGLCGFLAGYGAAGAAFLGVMLLILLLALTLYLVFSDPHNCHRVFLTQHKSLVLWSTSALLLAIVGATFWIPGMWGITLPKIQLPGDLLGYYGAQLSLTFITISVMSVLSDKSVVVYWENIAEAKLIKPLFGSFASYTAYSIVATVGAGISALLGDHLAFLVFFALNIPVLILLTLTMVDVYYGREGKKARLEKILKENASAWQCIQQLQSIPEDWDLTFELSTKATDHRSHMFQLEHHLHQAITEHDMPYINELLTLYGRNAHCFPSPEGQAVEALLHTAVKNPWDTILLSLDEHTSQLENTRERFADPFKRFLWCRDEALWQAFAENKYLKDYLQNLPYGSEVPSALAWTALHRMTLLFNDLITASGNLLSVRRNYVNATLGGACAYFQYQEETLFSAWQWGKGKVLEKDGLLSQLLQLLLLAAKFGTPQTLECIRNCPFLPLLADSFQFLGLSESDAKLLQSLSANVESFSPEA